MLVASQVNENLSYRPPIHRHASKVEEVYVVEDLVPSNVLNSLSDAANKLIAGETFE